MEEQNLTILEVIMCFLQHIGEALCECDPEVGFQCDSCYARHLANGLSNTIDACAGVERLGSVKELVEALTDARERELVEALTDAREVVRDRLRMAEAAGNKKDIKWASDILADAQDALAKFKLEADHAKTAVWQEYERARACVNACAGVAEMGSVKELVEAVQLCDYLLAHKYGFSPKGQMRGAITAALAKFKLEENNEQTR